MCAHMLACCVPAGGDGDSAVADRVERLLQAPAQLGLHTRAQCLEYLGSLFCGAIEAPGHLTDMQVCFSCLVVLDLQEPGVIRISRK